MHAAVEQLDLVELEKLLTPASDARFHFGRQGGFISNGYSSSLAETKIVLLAGMLRYFARFFCKLTLNFLKCMFFRLFYLILAIILKNSSIFFLISAIFLFLSKFMKIKLAIHNNY